MKRSDTKDQHDDQTGCIYFILEWNIQIKNKLNKTEIEEYLFLDYKNIYEDC